MAGQKLNLAPARTCPQGKRRHHTEADARRHLVDLARSDRFNRPTAGPLGVYHCAACSAWHVGHLH